MREEKPGRNAPYWCGSGKKYKKCHLDTDQKREGGPDRPLVPRARGYWEIRQSVLAPPQIRSDEVGPDRP